MKKLRLTFDDLDGWTVPRYCRKLMREENYPKMLEIYRGDTVCLTVDVQGASELTLIENEKEGPVYKKYKENTFLKAVLASAVEVTG